MVNITPDLMDDTESGLKNGTQVSVLNNRLNGSICSVHKMLGMKSDIC